LRTDTPSVELLRESVTNVLKVDRYKTRAKEIQSEMLSYDPIKVLIESIEAVANNT